MKTPKIKIPANVSRAFFKFGFQVKKYSPEILLGTGIATGVVGAVMACKATTKLDAVLESAKFEIDAVHKAKDEGEIGVRNADTNEIELVPYTAEDHKKDLAIVYARNGLRIAKLYAPAVAMGAASVTCLLVSHNIIHKRNMAIAAAYASVDNAFKNYQGRVIERFGEELDKELKYNIKSQEIEEVIVNEDGSETTVTKNVPVSEGPIASPYTLCFDETCREWTKNAEDNKFFLMQVQAEMNDRLKTKGHVFLNEVLDALGADRTQAGQIVGWVYNGEGDGYIDFGIYELHREANRRFVNGYERSIWLEFNVDGNIHKLLA